MYSLVRGLCCAALAAVAMLSAWTAAADVVVDFDDLPLPPNSYWNGPPANPLDWDAVEPDPWGYPQPIVVSSFYSGGVRFRNRNNLNFGSEQGFSYTNQGDTTTAGYLNRFSAYPAGSGFDPGADNFAVAYGYKDMAVFDPWDAGQREQLPWFELSAGYRLQSLMIANTTYAALSMLEGDSFAKRFGYSDAKGNAVPDGSFPDWYKVTAYGARASGELLVDGTGNAITAEIYLADYRAAANADDYVLKAWTAWDLSALAGATRIFFNPSSSDAGEYGMNTPACFAIDDLVLTPVPEPGSLGLLAAAIVGVSVAVRRAPRRGSARSRLDS